ncbi:MAG: TraX family protein [Bacillota bacterium]
MDHTTMEGSNSAAASYRNDMLKLFAMFTMLIDHIGYIFFPQYRIFRTIGRLAFPIFAYQVATGYTKTSNLKNYARRLFHFALLSQIPYSFFSPDLKFDPLHLNIMFLLLFSLGIIYVYDMGMAQFHDYQEKKDYRHMFTGTALLLGVCGMAILPEILEIAYPKFRFSYGMYGLLLVLFFYICRDKKIPMVLCYVLLSLFYTYFTGAKTLAINSVSWLGTSESLWSCLASFDIVWGNITTYKNGLIQLEGYFFQTRSILSLVPIYFLEQYETKIKLNKYIGYLFYPTHISIIIIIAIFERLPVSSIH